MAVSAADAVMSSLLCLSSMEFSALLHSLSLDLCLRRRRLLSLLHSPLHFSSTLSFLRTLSLPEKTLLLARLLLSSLHHLFPTPRGLRHRLRLRDLDAALLLMAMCDSYTPTPTPTTPTWHTFITHDLLLLLHPSPFSLGDDAWTTVAYYVDLAAKSRRFFEVVQGEEGKGGAAVAAVVALPSVECEGGGRECVICKEDVEVGRDVCELPCGHWFHWSCAIGWLKRRNTCPVCRFELPSEDVVSELRRVWRAVSKVNGNGGVQLWRL